MTCIIWFMGMKQRDRKIFTEKLRPIGEMTQNMSIFTTNFLHCSEIESSLQIG